MKGFCVDFGGFCQDFMIFDPNLDIETDGIRLHSETRIVDRILSVNAFPARVYVFSTLNM